MTSEEIVAHWRQGAKDAMEVAQLCVQKGKYELALFHCHLAVEKALKALYIEQKKESAPRTHDLRYLQENVNHHLTEDVVPLLTELSTFAIEARYTDPAWLEFQSSQENTEQWIKHSKNILSILLDA